MSKKFEYALPCDRLQVKVEHGKEIWNSLMAGAVRIDREAFEAACDVTTLLDDGETLDDYVASDENWAVYRSETAAGVAYFLQTAGFELFFTPDGKTPGFSPDSLTENYDEYGHSALARLLLRSNHPLLANAYGFEGEEVELQEDFVLIKGNGLRFQIKEDGLPIAGMHVLGDQIQDIYVSLNRRREGLATEIVARTEAFMGTLRHSDSLTPDGRAFVGAQKKKEAEDSLDF